jgi:hypothetical protein
MPEDWRKLMTFPFISSGLTENFFRWERAALQRIPSFLGAIMTIAQRFQFERNRFEVS